MSKRLTRIPGKKIKDRAEELADIDIHVVTLPGHILFGSFVSVSDSGILLKDKRDHTHEVHLKDIHEIVYDSKDPFRRD